MKRLVVTGFSSSISKELFKIIHLNGYSLDIIRCGRGRDSDVNVDFSSIEDSRKFSEALSSIEPDYCFINHGVLVGQKSKIMVAEDISKTLNVNLVSVAMILESLQKIQGVRTVVMSSISGKAGSYDSIYAAAKAGVDVLVKSASQTLPYSSRLNSVSPGIIEDARMTKVRTDFQVLSAKKNQTPTKKFCTSYEVARIVAFLLFESDNITGENININGGVYVG